MGGNVFISRNRTKIELDWKEFTSKSVRNFSFQCLTVFAEIKTFLRTGTHHFIEILTGNLLTHKAPPII